LKVACWPRHPTPTHHYGEGYALPSICGHEALSTGAREDSQQLSRDGPKKVLARRGPREIVCCEMGKFNKINGLRLICAEITRRAMRRFGNIRRAITSLHRDYHNEIVFV